MAQHVVTPGVIHLAGTDTDVRCLDVKPARQDKDIAKWYGLASAADVTGNLEPGQQFGAGAHRFGWSDIEWISFVDPLKTRPKLRSRAGDCRAE